MNRAQVYRWITKKFAKKIESNEVRSIMVVEDILGGWKCALHSSKGTIWQAHLDVQGNVREFEMVHRLPRGWFRKYTNTYSAKG